MLTVLKIGNASYDAVQLLTLMQQVWPEREQPTGEGDTPQGYNKPWKLQTAGHWYWAAKRIASYTRKAKFEASTTSLDGRDRQFWFNIAGRLISIQADSLYARDYGDVPTTQLTGAPGKVNSMEISYSGIYDKMLSEHTTFNDSNQAADLRGVLHGTKPTSNSISVRLLASVLFLSEVARNHTAFHTGLMLLDLIEAGVQIAGTSSFKYDFKSALWSAQTIDAILANKGKPKGDPGKVPVPKVAEESSAMAIPARGGETALSSQMGLGVMSHALSESGGAFDLTGKGVFQAPEVKTVPGVRVENVSNSLTYVRRKEATLLIRWLSKVIKQKYPTVSVAVGDEERVYDTQNAYEYVPQFFGDGQSSSAVMQYVVPLIKDRVSGLDKMIS